MAISFSLTTNSDGTLDSLYPNGDKPVSSSFTLPTMPESTGTTYYVRKSGNDSNGGLSRANAFGTLNYAQAQLSPNDILYVGEGTWTENSGIGFLSVSGQGDVNSANWGITVSGTAGNPITFMADPTNTNPVIIDSGHIFGGTATFRSGIFVGFNKYLNFSGFTIQNCMSFGIYNFDAGSAEVVTDPLVASDVWIENCTISGVSGADNDCGIGIWAGRRITMINNTIHSIIGWPANNRGGWGVLSFGLVDSLIRNNTIYPGSSSSQGGVFLKDHYVADAVTRAPTVEAEIAYNLITSTGTAIQIGAQPRTEAGENYIHHNICNTTSSRVGIQFPLAAIAEPTNAEQRIEHNLILGTSQADSSGMYFEATNDINITGNIIFGFLRMLESAYVTPPDDPFLINSCDRNVYDNSAALALLARYTGSVSQESYANLTAWQAVTAAGSNMVTFDGPDTNGVASTLAATITDAAGGDYTLVTGTSPAIGLMADGSDAGPYQNGDEIIGVVP